MDKLFYTLEETAQRLGVSVERVQAMTEAGDLQQYRDRDKVMYQRDQVEGIAGGSATGSFESDLKEATGISLEDTGTMDLSATGSGTAAATDTNTPSPIGLDETDSFEISLDDSASKTGTTDAADIMGITDDPPTDDGLTATASGMELDINDTGANDDLADFTDTGFGLSATGLGLSDSAGETGFTLDDANDASAAAPTTEDPKEQTGISVFDANEIDTADPMAQTQVSSPNIDDDMLALESVGSGSGLLDLTRESDDTSLGAELLDEIYPAAEGSDAKMEDLSGSSVTFETGSVSGIGASLAESGAEFESAGLSGLENSLNSDSADLAPGMGNDPAQASTDPDQDSGLRSYGPTEPEDPGGAGFVGGMLVGAFIALTITLIVAIPSIGGTSSAITEALGNNTTALYGTAGGILLIAIVCGVVCGLIGKASAR